MSKFPKNSSVFIVGGGLQYEEMFRSMGWLIADNMKKATLIQFTGGADVSPSLYGHGRHFHTSSSLMRDQRERLIFNMGFKWNKPMAGICRGGQFLNVMSGGKMYQHCDGHIITGTHKAIDLETGQSIDVTSTHHQIMNPTKDALTLLVARESTYVESFPGIFAVRSNENDRKDCEAVLYEKTKCLCFQPHPEFTGFTKLRAKYFDLMSKHLF